MSILQRRESMSNSGESNAVESDTEDTNSTVDNTGGTIQNEKTAKHSYDVSIDSETIAKHYERVRGVYQHLAKVSGYLTMGLDDLDGWYITRDEYDIENLKEGYTKRRRPASFEKDLDTVIERVDRTIYGLTTYKSRDAFTQWTPARLTDKNEYEYRGGKTPTPDIKDLRAVCVWGDIDLCDELKPKRGNLDPETKAIVEATLGAYSEEFGRLVGGTDAVYALDSVGGAYIFTAPEATIEISEYVAEEYGEEWVGKILRAVIDRSNDYLKEAQKRVEERVDGASEVIDPDWANNHNRKYKAPLSIHKDHAAVVTPLDTDAVDYSLTRLGDVDNDLVTAGEKWSETFTDTEFSARVKPLVAQLFDGNDETENWRETIDAFVEKRRTKQQKRDELQHQTTSGEVHRLDLSGFDITPSIETVEDAIDKLDIEKVANDTIVKHWTEDKSELKDRSGSGKKSIIPIWAGSYNSGNATYIDLEKNIFNDTDNGTYGTAVEMALIGHEEWDRGEIASGKDWARGVQYLRESGFDIPIWIPDAQNTENNKMPYWALRSAAIALGVIEEEELVKCGESDDTYLRFPDASAYNAALEAVEEVGFETRRKKVESSRARDRYTENSRNILELDVVVEPANVLAAASAVEPDDLNKPLPELERDDIDDVAIAVALADGKITDPSEFPSDGDYTDAYYRARDYYGAPLPKYLDNSTLEERVDLIYAALERVRPKHVLDGCKSEVTVKDPGGTAVAKLNPTWEESKSGERIIAGYGRGFYCVEHEVSFSPIQLAALENGYIDCEDDYPRGEAFKQSYRILREEYGAPIPKWRATILEHVAVLPPSFRVLNGSVSAQSLDDVYGETEALIRDAVSIRDRAQLITNAPNTGKTFSVAVVGDEQPILYIAKRNELKQQMEDYAREIRRSDEIDATPSTYHLPILCNKTVDEPILLDAVREVREAGRRLLHERDKLLNLVGSDLGEEFGPEENDVEKVDLDRATCPVASGEYGLDWALAVQTARKLGHTPADIHQNDTVLFGEKLPCQADGCVCDYSDAWHQLTKPENQPDILIGSPGHAYVDTATTYFDCDRNGERVERSRAVVIDEFLGESYITPYDDRSVDHATWLSENLVGIDNREDLVRSDLHDNTWVNCWLDGEGGEYKRAEEIIDLLEAGAGLCEAVETAEELLNSSLLSSLSAVDMSTVQSALENLASDNADLNCVEDTLSTASHQLSKDAKRAYKNGERDEAIKMYDLLEDIDDILAGVIDVVRVIESGQSIDTQLLEAIDELGVGGDLRDLLLNAVKAITDTEQEGIIQAAITVVRGGRQGCRELSIYAKDGNAHPNAWALLSGTIAQDVDEVKTATFAFDDDEGSCFKRSERNGATIVADKNHYGSIVVDTPAFTDIGGSKCPVLALDATGRSELWRLALGRDTQKRDIHDTDAERRRFLRDVMNLRVVQTSNKPLSYHSDPKSKNFGEDIELVRTVAEEYTGTGTNAVDREPPAVISTLKVLNHLESELNDYTSDLINYENMKGSDALGNRQVACVLGTCHYGDAAPEKWGLLAGESAGRGESRGEDLDYGSDVANAYLRYMREDHTMQAILRAGRNDDATVVFAHTSALRNDLPVENEGAVLSVHSKGTLAVVKAAREFRKQPFTADNIVDRLGKEDIGLRQVQNVLANLRRSSYLRVEKEGGPGVAYEYEVDEDPGLADVELPDVDVGDSGTNEKTRNSELYTWNFASQTSDSVDTGVIPLSKPQIPAAEAVKAIATGPPPG